MSSVSFLSQARKAHSNKSSRVVKELSQQIAKINTQNTVIEDEELLDIGATVKGRAIIEHGKLTYSRKITTIPTFKVPIEPDGQFLTFWIKANHTGLFLKDSCKLGDNRIVVNNNKHLCLVNANPPLDLGYLGKRGGVNSCTVWDLNGIDESAQVDDDPQIKIEGTTIGFSITAWIMIRNFGLMNGIERTILAKKDDNNNSYRIFVTPTNKAVVGFKHGGNEFKIETPATLVTNTWYFIAATFKSSVTKEAKIYLNAVVSTTPYAGGTVTYPDMNSFPGNKLQLFGNGIATIIDHLQSDEPPPWDLDTGAFDGQVRDIRIWREKILTQTEISNFNTNKVSISNLALGESHIAGFVFVPSDSGLQSSFTTTSFTSQSFNL